MIKISFLEFLIRGIPEGLIFFLAVHAFSKKTIEIDKYLFSSMVYWINVYLIKFLTIQNGTYLILNVIASIIIVITINKIDIIEAIKSCISSTILLLGCEGINVFVIQFILRKDINEIFEQRMLKITYLSPSLVVFGCIAMYSYIRFIKGKELCR